MVEMLGGATFIAWFASASPNRNKRKEEIQTTIDELIPILQNSSHWTASHTRLWIITLRCLMWRREL